MKPIPYDLYRAAYRVALKTLPHKRGGPVRPFKNAHPEWDCQPWQDGYAYRYATVSICEGHHDEMSSRYYVSPYFHKAALYRSCPSVMRWPR